MYPVPCSMYPVPCSMHPVPCLCTLFPVLCTLFPVLCTLFMVPAFFESLLTWLLVIDFFLLYFSVPWIYFLAGLLLGGLPFGGLLLGGLPLGGLVLGVLVLCTLVLILRQAFLSDIIPFELSRPFCVWYLTTQ